MTASNRVRITLVRESTAGTTPTTPRMRLMRLTGESLSFTPEYVDSDEIRSDRMLDDPIKVMQASKGGINWEMSYPNDESPLSELFRSAFWNTWTNTASRDNDGTADSVITDVATSGTIVTHLTGTSFVASQLVKFTGFTVTANNGVFKCTTGGTTTSAYAGSGITDEASVAAAARMKVVGFMGAAADITATSGGLGSTLLAFTGLGLAVGQWIKIGGTGTNCSFATAVLNDWCRITAIATNALTLDNKPSGWTTDAGTGKTIQVWFGDQIKNGTTKTSVSLEKGFMGQTTPTYIVNTGMVVDTLNVSMSSRQKITGSFDFMGMGGSSSTTSLDASPDAATTGQIMAANANVGRLGENGSQLTSPNWAKELTFSIKNNLRTTESIDSNSPTGINEGECSVTGKINTYFGSDTLLAKLYAGTATSVNARVSKNSQALIWQFPRVTIRSGVPAAAGKNQDVMLDSDFTASLDTTTSSSVILDRVEYFESA